MSDMSAFYGDFGAAEAAAIRKRKQRSVANTQSAMLGQLRGQRRMADIQKQYKEGFQPVVASYGRRGFGGPGVQSGIRTAGLEKYAEQLQKDLGSETESMQDLLNQVTMDEATAQAELEDYLAQLRFAKQQAVLQSAQNIKSLV